MYTTMHCSSENVLVVPVLAVFAVGFEQREENKLINVHFAFNDHQFYHYLAVGHSDEG